MPLFYKSLNNLINAVAVSGIGENYCETGRRI
jgi:hypothetical protein